MQEESNKHFNSLKFINEQLNLMIQNKFDYSTEMMVFSSLLYNCSSKGYKLLRNSKKMNLPSYSTSSTYVNPLIEQHDNNFLMYIKNKFKLQELQDATVSLIVDEIHLKPYINYKGGNIVGLSDNYNESATSAFDFMLSNVFSQYKDVMPTKCLKAVNLFDIVICIIIGLEEIDFQVLSIITDNNAINKKTISFFGSPPKAVHCISTPSYKVFFLFNSVHILECIRNNWIGQKDANKVMLFQKFYHNRNHELDSIQSALFCTFMKLHALESHSLFKYCYKLT